MKSQCLCAYFEDFYAVLEAFLSKFPKHYSYFIANCAGQPLEWGCTAAAHSGCVRRAWEFVQYPSCCFNIPFWSWIGIFDDLGFHVWVTFVSPPLMGNPRGQPNNCCKTFQYSHPATLAPKISTRVEVHASHPAYLTSTIL